MQGSGTQQVDGAHRANVATSPPDFDFDCDVLVVGGGPAGSTIAALLAEQGRNVLLLEKERHPRFHIGESLLPANAALFDRLGVREQVERIGMPKFGVEFIALQPEAAEAMPVTQADRDQQSDAVEPTTGAAPQQAMVEFAEAWDKSMPYAWQVRRSELDELLFRNAVTKGARGLEGCRVRRVEFDAEGARVEADLDDGSKQTLRTRFVVDASGRDTLLANQMRSKEKNKRHSSAALYAHFKGAARLPGKLEGNISLFWFEHGWFWVIPLADGATSVGAVCWPYYLKSRSKPLADFFQDTIALCPALQARLEGAELISPVEGTGNYSYSSTVSSGDRYLLLGDAFAFIDPVFSSGVLLAMQSGFAGADMVAARLDRPHGAATARRRFDRLLRRGPRKFSWFIFRISSPTMREFFLYPQNPMRVKEALMSLLAGDIYGKTPIWPSIFALKTMYYGVSLIHLGRSLTFWRRRKLNVQDVEAAPS